MTEDADRISVAVIDDQRLFRLGMIGLLAAEPDIEVVGESSPGPGACALVGRTRPEIILLDTEFGSAGSAQCIPALLTASPRSKLVVVTGRYDSRLAAAGAHGYVLRSAGRDELLVAVRAAHRGSGRVLVSVSRETFTQLGRAPGALLSRREREVMVLVAVGMRNSQIANRLYISEGTVKRHLTNAYLKLGAASRMAAVKKALSLGIVSYGDLETSETE
jgi:DNA-binding NarL/FixJ family response regulator